MKYTVFKGPGAGEHGAGGSARETAARWLEAGSGRGTQRKKEGESSSPQESRSGLFWGGQIVAGAGTR